MDDDRVGSAQVHVGDVGGPAPGFALGVGAVTALVTLVALHPLLVNLDGPFGEHATLGLVPPSPSRSSWARAWAC